MDTLIDDIKKIIEEELKDISNSIDISQLSWKLANLLLKYKTDDIRRILSED